MGTIDAATQNGSEQIYMPRQGILANATTFNAAAVARWNPGAKILVYDPTQANVTNPNLSTLRNVAAVMVYGRGFDDPNRGYVMYEAGHSHAKASDPANIAAQRAFFNFGFLASNEKAPIPNISAIPTVFNSATPQTLSITVSGGTSPYSISWSSSCGGTFSVNNSPSASTTSFTPPTVTSNTPCNIRVTISDACGREAFDNVSAIINACQLTFNNTITNVSCNGGSNGSIAMGITGSPGPFTWSWSRVSPAGTGSGSGTTISGLSAGTYNVTVTNGGACTNSFTATITQPNPLTASATATNYLCFGQTGAINLAVSGGTAPYVFNWTGPGGPYATQNLSGRTAGTYNVTVTDNRGCIATASATITGPASGVSVALNSKTNITCNGANNGTINITASGGTPGYTYLWSDGSTDEDRSGLAPGTYTVTVTDANGCTGTRTEIISQPPVLNVTVVSTGPSCPPGSNPPVNSDGQITVTATGGTAAYNVSWTGPVSGNPAGNEILVSGGNYTISNLPAGTYAITVVDVNGCTATVNVTITPQNTIPAAPANINNN
jgi:hypothetical protein